MTLLMVVILVAFLVVAYYVGKRKFLSPWFLLCAMMSVCFMLVLLNYKNWEVHINQRFVLYISVALLAFGLGTICIDLVQVQPMPTMFTPIESISYKRKFPVNLFMVLSCLLAFGYIGKLFIDVDGFSLSFSTALRKIYDIRIIEDYSPGFIFNQMREIITAIAYINTYRLLFKVFNNRSSAQKDKIQSIKLIIPILIAFIVTLISTDRNIFLRYIIYLVCLWMLFYYNTNKRKHENLKIVLVVVALVLVVVILFFLMGKMKNYTSDFFRVIGIYGGSGLYNFNLWIEHYNASPMWGASTFTQFISSFGVLLKPFGIELYGTVNRIDPYISFTAANGYFYSSNIYSALKPFVEDFGFFGIIIFPFALGVFYQWMYVKTKKSKYGMWWLLYCILIYPVVFFPILEQLFRRLHFGMVYEIAWPMILYWSIFKTKGFRIRRNNVAILNSSCKVRK